MSIHDLVEVSRRYGSNPDFVLAGGGNTSFKTGTDLYIKASGISLGSIEATGFVRMDRSALAAIWETGYPADPAARESAVLADLMAARAPGEEAKRPSVETLLHDLLPARYVVHTHPAIVNGLTCSVAGEDAARDLFGLDFIWIRSINPGYILSLAVSQALSAFRAARKREPEFILLQNHGIFVAADDIASIDAIYNRVVATLEAAVRVKPDFSGRCGSYGDSEAIAKTIVSAARDSGFEAQVAFRRDASIARFVASRKAFAPLSSAYSPDHIVYAGSEALLVEDAAGIASAWKDFVATRGRKPKILAVQNLGIFGIGASGRAADLALELFSDAVKVAIYSQAFGGHKFMDQDQIDFINGWEVERYRTTVSAGG